MTPKSLIAPARLARRPVLATQSDGRLVDLVRAGNDCAFEAIVTRYRAPLLRYVERFMPRERAEDAVQQSFVNAYEAMSRGRADLQLRPWLYRIAHNTALNALRDRTLRHSELSESIDGVERPDEAVERSLGLREAFAAVQALPDRQRDAIVLRELEGRSYDEIASELGVTDGSVRQLLHRARSTLREGVTAVTPFGLVARLPFEATEEPIAARMAELCGAGVGGAVVAKVCATALVTGAVVGGAAVVPRGGDDRAVGSEKAAAGEPAGGAVAARAGGSNLPGGLTAVSDHSGDERSGTTDADDRSGSGTGSDDDADDRSGSGTGDRSGPGPSGSDDADDHSGSGGGSDSSGPGSDGSGSGSGSGSSDSGSGSSDSGSGSSDSGSGSSDSGSGSSGSGSGSSGSGSGTSGSGSGSSGSGSGTSGSGSGSGSDSSGSGSSGSGSGGETVEPLAPLAPAELDSSGSGSGSSGSGSGSSGSGSSGSGSGSSGSG